MNIYNKEDGVFPKWKQNEHLAFDAFFDDEKIGSVEHLADNTWGATYMGRRFGRHQDMLEAKMCVENLWKIDLCLQKK